LARSEADHLKEGTHLNDRERLEKVLSLPRHYWLIPAHISVARHAHKVRANVDFANGIRHFYLWHTLQRILTPGEEYAAV
jgi:hypothetical protein